MPRNIEDEESKKAFPLASPDLTNEVRNGGKHSITFSFGPSSFSTSFSKPPPINKSRRVLTNVGMRFRIVHDSTNLDLISYQDSKPRYCRAHHPYGRHRATRDSASPSSPLWRKGMSDTTGLVMLLLVIRGNRRMFLMSLFPIKLHSAVPAMSLVQSSQLVLPQAILNWLARSTVPRSKLRSFSSKHILLINIYILCQYLNSVHFPG